MQVGDWMPTVLSFPCCFFCFHRSVTTPTLWWQKLYRSLRTDNNIPNCFRRCLRKGGGARYGSTGNLRTVEQVVEIWTYRGLNGSLNGNEWALYQAVSLNWKRTLRIQAGVWTFKERNESWVERRNFINIELCWCMERSVDETLKGLKSYGETWH